LSGGEWSLNVEDETRNHKIAKRFEGHTYVERLKPKETILVREMIDNLAFPNPASAAPTKRNKIGSAKDISF
jgi:hypothetical protein